MDSNPTLPSYRHGPILAQPVGLKPVPARHNPRRRRRHLRSNLPSMAERQSPGLCPLCKGDATIFYSELSVEDSPTPILRRERVECSTPGCPNFRDVGE